MAGKKKPKKPAKRSKPRKRPERRVKLRVIPESETGTVGFRLYGRGDGGDAGSGERGDGVRELRESTGCGHPDPKHSEHRVPLQEVRQLQRITGLEQWIECAEHVKDGRADQRQHLHDWHSVSQGWEAGDLALHIHLTLRADDGQESSSQEWCADLQRATSLDELLEGGCPGARRTLR